MKISSIILLLTLTLLTACARLQINPPSTDKQSLLVLPVQLENTAQHGRHGFVYIYEIKSKFDKVPAYQAEFKLPIEGDVLIVDSLPPGDYRVNEFRFRPSGSGNFTYGNNVQRRFDKFSLEAGKITIFSKSLNVRVYNPTAGRGMSSEYDFKLQPVSEPQKREILSTLQALEHFDSWEINNNDEANTIGDGAAQALEIDQAQLVEWATDLATANTDSYAGNISGTFVSEITSNHIWPFRQKKRRSMTIILSQVGNKISANDTDNSGIFFATREGDLISFVYTSGEIGYDIVGKWKINTDASKLEGSWELPAYDASGKWDLTRTD